MACKFTSKFLRQAYGFDVSGVVFDADQDNIRDKSSNPHRNPGKDIDFNTANMVTDSTLSPEEQEEIRAMKETLNPHIPSE